MHSGAWKTWAVVAVVLILVGIGYATLGPAHRDHKVAHVSPATVDHIEGSDVSRVTLTEKAAERVGIETAPVREELVERWRAIRGEVVSIGEDVFVAAGENTASGDGVSLSVAPTGPIQVASAGQIEIRVPRHRDLNSLNAEQLSEVLIEVDDDGDDTTTDLKAELIDDEDDSDAREDAEWLNYVVTSRQKAERLVPGQEVRVRVPLVRADSPRKVVPYGSVIYDSHGDTWVYTSPEPRVFIREKIVIEFIDGDLVVLSEGPAVGTDVLTVGTAEVFGTEFEVGH